MRRITYLVILSLLFSFKLCAQGVPALNGVEHFSLPATGKMIDTTPRYTPTLIKGVKIYPAEPFRFDFIIDKGQTVLEEKAFEQESKKLVKYFLASLTVPEDELWVNLSPYEKDKIIAKDFGQTEMGRDLLGQDYILKQLTASLLYPEKELGDRFWDTVSQQVKAKYGEIEIPVKTFNKVWIVPEDPVIYQNGDYAYVVSSKLKVMLEQDYLALKNNQNVKIAAADSINQQIKDGVSQLTSEIVREIILPAIVKEVNEGKNFAQLRQIQNSLVLAVWYKRTLQQSLLNSIYVDKNKTAGIDLKDKKISQSIYQQYLEAFKKGVFDYVKEEYDSAIQETVPKKYFSGGYSTVSEKGNLAKRTLVVSSVVQVPQEERADFTNYLAGVEAGTSEAVSVAIKFSSVSSSSVKQHYNPQLDLWKGFTAKAAEQLQEDMRAVDLLVQRFVELKQVNLDQSAEIKRKNEDLEQTTNEYRNVENLSIFTKFLPRNLAKKEALVEKIKILRVEIADLRARQETIQQERDRLWDNYQVELRAAIERGFDRFNDLQQALTSDQGLYEDFNEGLIDAHMWPTLSILQSQGKMSAELIDECLALIRENLKEGRPAFNDDSDGAQEARDRSDQRFQRLMEIERQVSGLSSTLLTGDQISPNSAYSKIIELIIRNERARWAQAMVDHISDRLVNGDFSLTAKDTITKFFAEKWDPNDDIVYSRAFISAVKKTNEHALELFFGHGPAMLRWEIFKSNVLVQSIFGSEIFDTLAKDLAEVTVEKLLVSETHTESAISLGYRLFGLAQQNPGLRVALAPYLIINSWREPGYSGEWPFILIHNPSNKTMVYEFVASLTSTEIAALRAENIPGLMQIIDAILASSDNFTKPRIANPDWIRFGKAFEAKGFKIYDGAIHGNIPADVHNIPYVSRSFEGKFWDDQRQEWVNAKAEVDKILASLGLQTDVLTSKDHSTPNPAYQEIQQGLAQLFKAYVQEENEAQQFFVMGLLRQISTADFEGFLGFLKQRFISSKSARLQDELLKMVAIKVFDGQKSQADFNFIVMLLESFDSVSRELQDKIREKGPELFNSFWQHSELTDEHIRLLSKVLGKDEQAIKALINFLKDISPYQAQGYGHFYRPEKFEDFLELAQQQGAVDTIRQLAEYGYTFTIEHFAALKNMISQPQRIVDAVVQIRTIFPDFKYTLEHTIRFNPATQRSEGGYISDPYEIVFSRFPLTEVLGVLYALQEKQGSFPRGFTDGLLRSLRANDFNLSDITRVEEPDETTYQQFYIALQILLRESLGQQGKIREYLEFYLNVDVLRYIARNPASISEVLSLPETVPQLFELLKEGGALYSNRGPVGQDIFANGNALARARTIIAVFTQKVEYWQQLFLFTEVRLGSQLDSSTSEYPISELESMPIKEVVAQEPTGTVIRDVDIAQRLMAGELEAVPFDALSPKYKRLVYRDYLRKTIILSQSNKAKQQADYRNRMEVSERLVFEEGDYIHGSPVDVIEQVLLYGNLPYESLGASARADSYPFHVDFTRLTSQYMADKQGDIAKIIDKSLSSTYGDKGEFYSDGQLWYVYKRSTSSWEHGINYGPRDYHALIMGGMPATEIAAIVLRNPESMLQTVKRAVLENGFYIPIYDLSGQLLFRQSEYDAIRSDLNLSVPVTTWDFSMKTGEQKGSNPGAEFTVSEIEGPVKYYIKFGSADELDHIWVETLADSIYRVLGIPVPETKIVKVDGNYGHASRILPLDGVDVDTQTGRQLKDGFLADSLLANWDIPYAYHRNTALSDRNVYRLDNGGALIFRARGQRKTSEQFGFDSSVRELEIGTNRERLGFGMRQVYEEFGLTNGDVLIQAKAMRDRLDDTVIDQLVDHVRLSKDTRDFIKATLKHRRNYILKKFEVGASSLQSENIDELTASSSLINTPAGNKASKDNLGGIDLNPAMYRLRIERDDRGVPLPMPQQPSDVQNIKIDGLFPVIINIMPVQSLPGVLLSSSAK